MNIDLSEAQRHARLEFRDFAAQLVAPYADEHDRRQEMPLTIIKEMVARGYQGAPIPSEFGGGGMDALTWGLLCEEIGGASASLLSILTVHAMVAQALCKWGTDDQRRHWLPRLAAGEVLGAFALTEPNIGSDAGNVESTAVLDGGQWRLNADKRWISFGQAATLFLVFAKVEGKAAAFLVERGCQGLSTEPYSRREFIGSHRFRFLACRGSRARPGALLHCLGMSGLGAGGPHRESRLRQHSPAVWRISQGPCIDSGIGCRHDYADGGGAHAVLPGGHPAPARRSLHDYGGNYR